MVGRPIHSRTADTATVLSISQPAPIHREYEKNISRKFIYILLILKCNFLFILIPYVVKTWVFQFFLFHKKYIYQLQKSFASVIFKWTSSHSLLTYRPSCHFEFSGWPNFCHHHLNLDLGSQVSQEWKRESVGANIRAVQIHHDILECLTLTPC